MKISVITVCKNADAYIEQSIQSVVNQTYSDVEYLIIDGKSSDRTLDIVNAYSDKMAYVVSEPDDGIYAAMNKGIRKATGDFLYFLNSDDYLVDSHVFQELADFISQQPKCEFVYGQMEMRMGKSGRAIQRIPRPVSHLKEALLSYSEGPQHAASFFGRHLFERLGLFDETYRISADYDWFLRLAQDSEAAVCYFPRMISSCSNQGLSCRQQNLGLQECFRALDDAPLYQNQDWLEQRVQYLQQQYMELYDNLLNSVNKPSRFANSSRSNALLDKTAKLREQLRQLS